HFVESRYWAACRSGNQNRSRQMPVTAQSVRSQTALTMAMDERRAEVMTQLRQWHQDSKDGKAAKSTPSMVRIGCKKTAMEQTAPSDLSKILGIMANRRQALPEATYAFVQLMFQRPGFVLAANISRNALRYYVKRVGAWISDADKDEFADIVIAQYELRT